MVCVQNFNSVPTTKTQLLGNIQKIMILQGYANFDISFFIDFLSFVIFLKFACRVWLISFFR